MGNLALNKPAIASGCVSPFDAARAVDGSPAPVGRWLCDAMPCWLAVDLGAPYWIDRWIVKHMGAVGWWSPHHNYNMKDFKLQGSMDSATWADLDLVAGNSANMTDRSMAAAQARYVRVVVAAGLNANQGVASIVELEVYESPYRPYLAGLSVSSGALSPAFSPKTFAYAVQVGNEVERLNVTPTAEAAGASIKVNGGEVESGKPSGDIALGVGQNPIKVEVTASTVTQRYDIIVTRRSKAYLSGLELGEFRGGPIGMEPPFKKDTLGYTASTLAAGVTVTPTAEQTGSAIRVNGTPVASGRPSPPISLNTGANTVTVQVTPADGGGPTVYTITVTKTG